MKQPLAPSSHDVARLAGVSRSAFSRTCTEGASVSPATREKVLAAAGVLGYRPNAIARTLSKRESRIVGVVMADMANPFYCAVLDALSEKLQRQGRTVLLFSARDAHDIDKLVPQLLDYQVDAVIIASATLSSSLAQQCQAAGKRVLLLNRYTASNEVHAVVCDNAAGGRLVADLLVDKGRSRLAFMAGVEDTSSSIDRERGFRERLAERGAPEPLRGVGHYTYEGGREAARDLLSRKSRPDAVFCANDMMALAVIDVARSEYGLSVPRDLAVVGFDNTPTAALGAYDLTSVDQNVESMTDASIASILRPRSQDKPASRVLIPCRIVMRGSTGS